MLSSLNSLSRLGRLGLPPIAEEADPKGSAVAQQDVGQSSGVWDFLKAATNAATTVYGNTLAAKQPPPAPSPITQAPTDYSKVILYGGIAVVGIGALLYFTRRKKR